MHFASVHSWWSQEPSGTWSIETIEVALSKGWEITYGVDHIFNPLTTDDVFWRLTLGVCYQLVQAVLKIRGVLSQHFYTPH